MKTVLHYLNWALHYFNRACLYIIKNYLKLGIVFIVMLVVSMPVLYFDSEEAIGLWGIVLFFGALFITITWMIRHEKPETKELTDQLGMTDILTEELGPKDWKQSAVSSAKWTLYAFFVLITAAIIIDVLNPDPVPEGTATLAPVCPDDYPDTDEGSESHIADTNDWTNAFFDENPEATLEDWANSRYQFYLDNNCTDAIARHKAAVSGEADTSSVEEIINEVLSE